jgi:hypothetical protein
VPWLRRLLAGLLPWRTAFDTGSVHVGYGVEKWHCQRFLSDFFLFALSVLLHQCSMFICVAISREKPGKCRKELYFEKPFNVSMTKSRRSKQLSRASSRRHVVERRINRRPRNDGLLRVQPRDAAASTRKFYCTVAVKTSDCTKTRIVAD